MITIELSTGKEIQLTVDEFHELQGVLGGSRGVERVQGYVQYDGQCRWVDAEPPRNPWEYPIWYGTDGTNTLSGDGVHVWG